MKNKERFEKEIVEIACDGKGIAVDKRTGDINSCDYITCHNCVFNDDMNCDKLRREWAESEYAEKLVISKRDKTFLDYLDKKLKYIVKDSNGGLFAYKAQPRKAEAYCNWFGDGCLNLYVRFNVDFPMVKWEDDEPWLIEDLKKLEVVEEYEK